MRDVLETLLKEILMFYTKNVTNMERAIRVILGVLALIFAAMNFGSSALAVGAGIVGAVLALTGLFGFCPMCALAGRKLDKKN